MAAPTPTDAHQARLALYNRVLLAVAARRQDDLPDLTRVCQDDVLVTSGGTKKAVHGWLAPGAWRYGDRHVHELFLNADGRLSHPSISAAEGKFVTLVHEACHLWAEAHGIQDISRQGRSHKRPDVIIARSARAHLWSLDISSSTSQRRSYWQNAQSIRKQVEICLIPCPA
jgi:hypothetical protein